MEKAYVTRWLPNATLCKKCFFTRSYIYFLIKKNILIKSVVNVFCDQRKLTGYTRNY